MNLDQLYSIFPDQAACLRRLEKVRWQGSPTCPRCNGSRVSSVPKENRYHCNNCNVSFSPTTATPFHHTHSDLQKWFLAIHLILHAKRPISVRRMSRTIQLNKNTTWHIIKRIRLALKQQRRFLEEVVELED